MSTSRKITALAAASTVACVLALGSIAPASATTQGSAATAVTARTTSVSQDQARRKALEYLSVMAFSRTGLIKQLMFDGFNRADATYGANAVHANWYRQAALKAKEYLKVMAFSRQGLINQLKYDGFTTGQATYGAKSVGL